MDLGTTQNQQPTGAESLLLMLCMVAAWHLCMADNEKHGLLRSRQRALFRLSFHTVFDGDCSNLPVWICIVGCLQENLNLQTLNTDFFFFKTQLVQISNWENLIAMQENVSSTWWRNVWRWSAVVVFFVCPPPGVEERVNAAKGTTACDTWLPTAFLFMFCWIIGPQFVSKAFNCTSLKCTTKATSRFPH